MRTTGIAPARDTQRCLMAARRPLYTPNVDAGGLDCGFSPSSVRARARGLWGRKPTREVVTLSTLVARRWPSLACSRC